MEQFTKHPLQRGAARDVAAPLIFGYNALLLLSFYTDEV